MLILTYHSLSDGPGPLRIPPEVFRRQMAALSARGKRGVSLAHALELPHPDQVVLTFDDGYRDVWEVAGPELAARGFQATLFLAPAVTDEGRMPEPSAGVLMSWPQARELQQAGWEIGSHACTHRNLARLPAMEARREVERSQERLQEILGQPVRSFAAPFGICPPALAEVVASRYQASVGTRLGVADGGQRHDLPRLEMHYYRALPRLEALLDGRGESYLRLRRALRLVRQAVLERHR